MPVVLRDITGGVCSFGLLPKKSKMVPSSNVLHREFLPHLHLLAALDWDSSPLPGDGRRSEDAPGQHWCVEDHWPLGRWCGVHQLHGEDPWAARAYPSPPSPPQPLSWNGSPDFPCMGQVPSVPQSSVKFPRFSCPRPSSPATASLASQVCLIAGLYLNVLNAWILTYLSQSFRYSIPWEHCPLLKNSSDFGERGREFGRGLRSEDGVKERQRVEGRRNEMEGMRGKR